MRRFNVGVLGATGAVGREILSILGARNFPVDTVRPLASERSLGETVEFRGGELAVQVARDTAFEGLDIVLASAGGSVSAQFQPAIQKAGAVMIDNTSHFRMDPDVPLVVPEVNPDEIARYKSKNVIANPNCSTIQLVLALKPLADAVGLKRVVVSTYQSVSGGGQKAIEELWNHTRSVFNSEEFENEVFPKEIAFNVIPQIDVFLDSGYTKEEWKMQVETPKILGIDVPLTATCVRVPVFYAHSEAVWVETEKKISPDQARELFAKAPGLRVLDDPANGGYPVPRECQGMDDTFVGRIREDRTVENGLAFWVVSDNIRKGAALNAVQIAEKLATIL